MKQIKIRFDRRATIFAPYDYALIDFLEYLQNYKPGRADPEDVRTLLVYFQLQWPPVYKEKWDGKPLSQNFLGYSVMNRRYRKR